MTGTTGENTWGTENLRRAQLLADTAFDILMWNPNGDGTTFTERPITERERIRVESMTQLSQAYAEIAQHEAITNYERLVRSVKLMGRGTNPQVGTTQTGEGN